MQFNAQLFLEWNIAFPSFATNIEKCIQFFDFQTDIYLVLSL